MIISSHSVSSEGEFLSQDVEYIKLETDRLDDGISLHGTSLHHSRVGKNLLRTMGSGICQHCFRIRCSGEGTHSLVQDKSPEDSETAVHGDSLRDCESSDSHRKGHRCQSAECDDGDASEEWSAPVEVFVISGTAASGVTCYLSMELAHTWLLLRHMTRSRRLRRCRALLWRE